MSAIPTIAEAAALIERKSLSPVELTAACFARIDAADARLHAFITRTDERAQADARAAEAEIAGGTYRGPLHGIPLGLKDIYETAGIRTTAHSRQLADYVPGADATTVRRLADAGTVLMGKLATHEFALGGPSFDLPWPPARNPWDPARFTGGSSSGTAAALAAGFVLAGTGSDTGGSIRTPASYCGLAGLKPTYGLVPRTGILPLAYSLDHAGPLAWTVEDCAILLQAMAGHDPSDPACSARPVQDYRAGIGQGIAGLRVGVVRHFFERDNPVSPQVGRALDDAIAGLRAAGARVADVTLPPLQDWYDCGTLINLSEAFAVHADRMRTHMHDYGELLRDRLALGGLIGAGDYVRALRRRRVLRAELAAAMRDADVLVTATVGGEAPPIDGIAKWGSYDRPNFMMPFNLSGYPALAVCIGFGEHGLPLGMQLVGRPFEEPLLLQAGHVAERLAGTRDRRPAL